MLGEEKKSKFIMVAEVLPKNKFSAKLLKEREEKRLLEEERMKREQEKANEAEKDRKKKKDADKLASDMRAKREALNK